MAHLRPRRQRAPGRRAPGWSGSCRHRWAPVRWRTPCGSPSRMRRTGAGPATVVGKFTSGDAQSHATGRIMRAYEVEVRFYAEIAPRVAVRHPRLLFAAIDAGGGLVHAPARGRGGRQPGRRAGRLRRRDGSGRPPPDGRAARTVLGGARPGRQLLGQPGDAGQRRVHRLHRERRVPRASSSATATGSSPPTSPCSRPSSPGWADGWPAPVGRRRWCTRTSGSTTCCSPRATRRRWWSTTRRSTGGAAPTTWPTSSAAASSRTSRRAHVDDLLAGYHEALVDHGVTGYTLDQLRADYRRECFGGLMMAVGASMMVKQTPRGDEMFITNTRRHAQQALDLDALADLSTPEATLAGGAAIRRRARPAVRWSGRAHQRTAPAGHPGVVARSPPWTLTTRTPTTTVRPASGTPASSSGASTIWRWCAGTWPGPSTSTPTCSGCP